MDSLNLLWATRNEQAWLRRQQRLSYRNYKESIDEMTDNTFVEHYRLSKDLFRQLCNDLQMTGLRETVEMPLELKVLCALSFFASGSDQRMVGAGLEITQRTTSRLINEVVDALNHPNILKKWIVFPQTREDRQRVKQEFHRMYNLAGVIGCIDCTHIPIVTPAIDEHHYFNRKGFHSLNVQVICDANLRITNVNSKFGGPSHDSYIWSNSVIEPYMRGLNQSGELVWLLGDSGYPQRPWLMTPILNAARGSLEEEYTSRHVQARCCIERCFGVLKSRWRCLNRQRVLHYAPNIASKITLACCVLHNMAVDASIPPQTIADSNAESDDAIIDPIPFDVGDSDVIRGRAMRAWLIHNLL